MINHRVTMAAMVLAMIGAGAFAEMFHLTPAVDLWHTEEAAPTYRYAVDEAQRLLQRLGADVTMRELPPDAGPLQLQLRPAGAQPALAPPHLPSANNDGYVIDVQADGIHIGADVPKGVLNGVYDVAQRLGFLFLYPGEAGEWPPQLTDAPALPMATGTFVVTPRFPYRGIFNGSSAPEWAEFYAKLRMNALCQPTDRALAERCGLRIEVGGHDLDELMLMDRLNETPALYRMNQPPDFFGKRVNDFNLCVSNAEAKRLIQENYRPRIRDLARDGIYAWHTWPEDLPAGGWCHCETCRSFNAADQAMLTVRMLAEVVAEEALPVRVPMLAYHDTMFPGPDIAAPKEAFLLYAPRTRCYAHALDDPACPNNRVHLDALKQWEKTFHGISDAHTFEYYLDRVLYRGLYPFLPEVVLRDMRVYETHGIETHLELQVGTAFVPRLTMHNLPLFAQANWDPDLTPESYIAHLSARILPQNPAPWVAYLERRAAVFQDILRWEHTAHGWADYRWLPETTSPFGQAMVKAYDAGAEALNEAATALEAAIAPDWPQRVRDYATSEVRRTRFEAAETRVMAAQQRAANHIGAYLSRGNDDDLRHGIDWMGETLTRLDAALAAAQAAGIAQGDYYYMFNDWIRKELEGKIETWSAAAE